jgi:4-hydroxybenzoate polyprenyltransferase
MSRWWIYQRERFPVFAHGLLILAFSACAVSFSALLKGNAAPTWSAYAVAFGVCFLMFLQLRIADEFKDAEEDARWRPYRPVPRGLVKLSELRIVFIASAMLQAAMAFALDYGLLVPLVIAWTYLALMSVEFFMRDWLKKRPVVYLLSHMGIMPLVDFFGTACQWMPSGSAVPGGLAWFLAASFFNGLVIEIGRKSRQPGDEEEGVETYSRLWGKSGAAAVWVACLLATLGCASMAAVKIDFVPVVVAGLGVVLVPAAAVAMIYARKSLPGKWIESLSGLWTLALYLLLGLVPLWLRN